MGWSGGGGSANPDNETIKTNVQGQLYVVPNPAAAGETSANGVGVSVDGSTIKVNSSNQLTAILPSVSVNDVAKTSELELTSTSATTVATYTPSASGNFVLFVYARVVTAATTLTLTASWTDAAGAQTYTWLNAISEPVGSYTFLPLFINSTTSAITITATAGTANQVYCSANIVSLS
ncbi:MAG: hypothetical protein QXH07_03115 [Thermoplasmata archaeon]